MARLFLVNKTAYLMAVTQVPRFWLRAIAKSRDALFVSLEKAALLRHIKRQRYSSFL